MIESNLDALWKIVSKIPKGKVMTYGDVGKLLPHPASGFQVGRWMASCPDGVPWWRVVAKTGSLPIGKRAHHLHREQMRRLKAERVRISADGVVDMAKHRV